MEDKSKSVIEPNNLDKTLETKTEYQENSNMIDTPEQNLFEETQQEDSGYLSFDTASEYIYAEQSQAQGGNNNEQKSKLWLYILAGVLMVVCIVTVLLNAFVFIKIEIDGKSMENTLQHGDIVTANKVIDPDYGDIIVISGELYIDGVESWIVKRAIAFGGDSVKIENGLVYLKKQG